MRYALIAVMVAALAVPAFAGYNSGCKMFVHIETDATPDATDNSGVVNEILSPSTNTLYYAHIGLADVGVETAPPDSNGFTTISLKINDLMTSYPGVVATQSFTSTLPGGLTIGDAFTGDGITCAATNCMLAPFQYIGYVQFFFLGGACTVEVIDHVAYPRWVVDCQEPGQVDYYCVWKQGGVGMAAPAGDMDCDANTPVTNETWGNIKALYR